MSRRPPSSSDASAGPPLERRQVLAGLGIPLVAGLTGCSAPLGASELAHYVEAVNRTRMAHTLEVRVLSASGAIQYEERFDLPGGTMAEATEPFTGNPERLRMVLDGGDPVERAWPPNRCDERGVRSAGGVQVLVTDEGLQTTLECDTVYADQ